MAKKKKVFVGIITTISIAMITTWVIEPLRDFVVSNIFIKAFDFILKILSTIWNFLTNNHEINGFVIVFSVFAWIFVFFIIIKDNIFDRSATYKEYIQDNIMGLKWKWYWNGNDIANLWCLCPYCDYELSYTEEGLYYGGIPQLVFKCEHCQNDYTFNRYNKNYFLSVIEREIRRKIRIGEKPDKKEVSHA
jgi:hypothetical protein